MGTFHDKHKFSDRLHETISHIFQISSAPGRGVSSLLDTHLNGDQWLIFLENLELEEKVREGQDITHLYW